MVENVNIEPTKVFRKSLWLKSALEDKAKGIINDKEIEDACEIWVDALDGKTYAEIVEENGVNTVTREDWFE